nr:hypothetical protein [Tanacetum cinerariifolium]
MNGCSVYSMSFLSCFGGPHFDEKYSFESAGAIVEVHGNDSELLYGEEEDYLVDEKAEKFIERFYEEMKRQRRESLAANLPLNRSTRVEGYLTEKELHQLILDEEALRETLEEETRAQKEFDEINKRLEEEVRKEQAHDELFRLEFRVKSDSEYESD